MIVSVTPMGVLTSLVVCDDFRNGVLRCLRGGWTAPEKRSIERASEERNLGGDGDKSESGMKLRWENEENEAGNGMEWRGTGCSLILRR